VASFALILSKLKALNPHKSRLSAMEAKRPDNATRLILMGYNPTPQSNQNRCPQFRKNFPAAYSNQYRRHRPNPLDARVAQPGVH
jgi:hypothetical protein